VEDKPMRRRDFLSEVVIAGAAIGMRASHSRASDQANGKAAQKWRGVNLGGWLALEKWITPSVYAAAKAEDEYTLCEELGKAKARERLKRHRDTWVTDDDFRWLHARGINAVRLPVNYGIAEENPPFLTAMDTLDWAFATAKKHGIGVLLDLHGVPGSQNGWDHSGRQGTLGWHTSKENIDHSLRIVAGLASRCKNYDNLIGFELLNEPRSDVPLDIIKKYYQNAYHQVREHIPREGVAVVIHDAFRPRDWEKFMVEPEYKNVILDTHPYQCFTDDDRKRDLYGQVQYALIERKKLMESLERQLPCIAGEWSCALPPESLGDRTGLALDTAMRAYGDAQLINFDTTRGWFFWTLKTEEGGAWSFQDCVSRGWLPEKYNA
jgi:glucan 1,3-beta-glucosidase